MKDKINGFVPDRHFCFYICLLVTISLCDSCCLPVGLMKASGSVIDQRCHPVSFHSVICLAPSPLQEHFLSACKMITGWLLDFPLFFSVYSPFLPSSHLPLFLLSLPLCCSPAHPTLPTATYNLNSLTSPSLFFLLHHFAFLVLLFSSLKMDAVPQGVVSREQRKEEALSVESAPVPKH